MKKICCVMLFPFLIVFSFSGCRYVAFKSPLNKTADIPQLAQAINRSVKIEVKDERVTKDIYGGGFVGPGLEKEDSLFVAFSVDKNISLPQFIDRTANETVSVLGLTSHDGDLFLEVIIKDSWIDMYRYTGFSPMNCLGYNHFQVNLKNERGEIITEQAFKTSYYENTTPAWSMEEIPKEAMSRIFSQAVWESVSDALLDQQSVKIDPEKMEVFMKGIDNENDNRVAREMIFWLGLAGKKLPSVNEKLLDLFRNKREQRIRQAAVEAIGKLGIQEARQDILDILSGAKKIGYWSNNDAEEVFYLLKALNLLGEKDLAAYLPNTEFRMRKLIKKWIDFQTGGDFPANSAKVNSLLQEIQKELKNE